MVVLVYDGCYFSTIDFRDPFNPDQSPSEGQIDFNDSFNPDHEVLERTYRLKDFRDSFDRD